MKIIDNNMDIKLNLPDCIVINNKLYKVVDTIPDNNGFIRSCDHCAINKICDNFEDCLVTIFDNSGTSKHFEEFEVDIKITTIQLNV